MLWNRFWVLIKEVWVYFAGFKEDIDLLLYWKFIYIGMRHTEVSNRVNTPRDDARLMNTGCIPHCIQLYS